MKILRGTLFGGIAYFLIGWLVYGVLLYNFFAPMTTMYNSLVPVVLETLASAVVMAIVGMIIVLTWGRPKEI